MQLIPIQDNILVNPDKISVIEKTISADNRIVLTITVDGRMYTVFRPHNEFFDALNKAGVDLTKQFFAV